MNYILNGASIECMDADLVSRKIVKSSIINIPGIGNCVKYICKRNSEAKILKALDKSFADKRENKLPRIEVGDQISGEDIYLLVNKIRPLKIVVDNHTGRHKAQKSTTGCYTYAEISAQFHNINEIKDSRQFIMIEEDSSNL